MSNKLVAAGGIQGHLKMDDPTEASQDQATTQQKRSETYRDQACGPDIIDISDDEAGSRARTEADGEDDSDADSCPDLEEHYDDGLSDSTQGDPEVGMSDDEEVAHINSNYTRCTTPPTRQTSAVSSEGWRSATKPEYHTHLLMLRPHDRVETLNAHVDELIERLHCDEILTGPHTPPGSPPGKAPRRLQLLARNVHNPKPLPAEHVAEPDQSTTTTSNQEAEDQADHAMSLDFPETIFTPESFDLFRIAFEAACASSDADEKRQRRILMRHLRRQTKHALSTFPESWTPKQILNHLQTAIEQDADAKAHAAASEARIRKAEQERDDAMNGTECAYTKFGTTLSKEEHDKAMLYYLEYTSMESVHRYHHRTEDYDFLLSLLNPYCAGYVVSQDKQLTVMSVIRLVRQYVEKHGRGSHWNNALSPQDPGYDRNRRRNFDDLLSRMHNAVESNPHSTDHHDRRTRTQRQAHTVLDGDSHTSSRRNARSDSGDYSDSNYSSCSSEATEAKCSSYELQRKLERFEQQLNSLAATVQVSTATLARRNINGEKVNSARAVQHDKTAAETERELSHQQARITTLSARLFRCEQKDRHRDRILQNIKRENRQLRCREHREHVDAQRERSWRGRNAYSRPGPLCSKRQQVRDWLVRRRPDSQH